MRKILERCPTCGGQLIIREVRCVDCGTEVRAEYRQCDFCLLTDEQATFLKIFVTSRGNLSEVEKRLGISYPTVRSKLDEIVNVLTKAENQPVPMKKEPAKSSRRSILDAVARGEISPEEALSKLRSTQ